MSLLFSTTPYPSSQEEGTTGSWRADTGVCPYGWVFCDNKRIMGNPDLLRIAHCKGYSSVIIYFTTILNFVRARSRSEELEHVQFFSHLITTFLPFWM